MDNLFERFDKLIGCRDEVIRYADSMCGQLHEAEDHAAKKVITTLGYDLGIACPSPLRYIVIGGNKKGKVIGNIRKKITIRSFHMIKTAPLLLSEAEINSESKTLISFSHIMDTHGLRK